jgi:hypothetical protein
MQDCNRDWFWQALGLYKRQSRGKERRRKNKKKKKIQREPNLHITIDFIFLQYQPPETEATEQGKHKNKRGENAEKNQGTTGEANETETERSIGQPTHKHQPCIGLHRPLNRRTTSREPRTRREHRRTKTQTGGKTGESIKKVNRGRRRQRENQETKGRKGTNTGDTQKKNRTKTEQAQ